MANTERDEERRRAIEDVYLAFHQDLPDEFRTVLRRKPVPPEKALENLAASDVSRMMKQRLTIDARRRSLVHNLAPDVMVPAFEAVLRSSLPDDADRSLTDNRVQAAMAALEEVARVPQPDSTDPGIRTPIWGMWVGLTDEYFAFTTEEKTFEACNDETTVGKPTPNYASLADSRLIVSQFESDLPPSAFASYVDPEMWPRCSPFWKSMTEHPANNKTLLPNGYDCSFLETVSILGHDLAVPLDMAYRTSDSRCWTRFNIGRRSYDNGVEVDVDTGTVSAERPPGATTTLVRATKYVHWRYPGTPDYSSLSCDLGWCDLMVQMAYRCAQGPAPMAARGPAASAPATTSVDDATKTFAEGIASEYGDGAREYTRPLEALIGRFTGPTWDARWINDLLDMSKVTVDRAGRIAGRVRRFADDLRDAGRTDGGDG
jgi:hypothetical protein